jgi:hypothetical protein
MEANMTPINDSNMPPPPPPQSQQRPNFLNDEREDEQQFQPNEQQQQYPPHFFHPQQVYPVHDKASDIFTGFDKTAYIIIFVAFILGFFMGKTMQPVILRPN